VHPPLPASPHHADALPKSSAAVAYRSSSDKEGREPHRAAAFRSEAPSLSGVGRGTIQSSTDMAAGARRRRRGEEGEEGLGNFGSGRGGRRWVGSVKAFLPQ